MVQTTQRRDAKQPILPTPGGDAAAVQRKSALRGASYDEQVQMLAPGGAVQREAQPEEGGGQGGGGAQQEGSGKKGFFGRAKDKIGGALDAMKNPKAAIYGARLGAKGRQEGVLDDGHDIPNQDVILEQLAHQGAYGRLDLRKLQGWGYREAGASVDPESGFRAVLYVPTEEALAGQTDQAKVIRAIHGGPPPTVLAFRGTAEKRGMQDDTHRGGVGSYQFASNEGRVREMLGVAGGKVIVTGHSLGGALAQLAATHFPSSVSRVVTFQSPGISKDEADKVKQHNAAADAAGKPGDRIESTHHRAEGDLVHMAGEALTEGDVYTHKSVGVGTAMDHMAFPLARLSAARGDMIPGVNDEKLGKKGGDRLVKIEKSTTEEEKSGPMSKMAESVRKGAGGLVRDETMEHYTTLWTDIKTMIASGAFGRNQVLGIIASAVKITPEQKTKMRDAALKLFGERDKAQAKKAEPWKKGVVDKKGAPAKKG